MGRREQAAELRQTWMVMREPQKGYPSRKKRRATLAQALRAARRSKPGPDTLTMPTQEAVQVPMQE